MSHILYQGDCRKGLVNLAESSVSLIVTSPPYKNEDNYSEGLISEVAAQCFRVLKNDSLCFVNFGSLAEDKFRPFRVCDLFIKSGFSLNDTIVWVKNHYKPIQGSRRLNNLTEFIFLLYKGKMPKIDRLAVGIPYKDKSNINRYGIGADIKCAGNVWYINYETINKSEQKIHNDRFPLELPEKCIKLSGITKESLVLDVFAGSGTTGIAAKRLGMNFIGFEINEKMHSIANERLSNIG